MRALVLQGLGRMKLIDRPPPTLSRPRDVLIRVTAVGVCGSDIHYYTTGHIGSQIVTYPFMVGHEFGGVVAATGTRVTRVKPGDCVAVDPAMPCNTCDQCRAGRSHTCRNLRFLGCPGQAEGCLCDWIVMPEDSCFGVPPNLTDEDAALVEPLSIGCYAIRLAGELAGRRIAILGCGPIGLSVLLAARQAGVAHILASDPLASRQALARRLGATWTGSPAALNGQTSEQAERDVVFECCGQQDAMDQGVALLKPGGKLVLIGIPEFDRASFAVDLLRRKELCLQNVRRQNTCVEPAIALCRQYRSEIRSLITHRFPAERTAEAFDLVAGYRDGVVKAMISFKGGDTPQA
jgi:L-iditol 2-dehydrogenase